MPEFYHDKIVQLGGHAGPINTLAYSSGIGQYILSGSSDRCINLYNPSKAYERGHVPNDALVQSFKGAHGYEVLTLCVSNDNSQFISGGGDKTVFLWDVASAQTIRRYSGSFGHTSRVECVAFGGENDTVMISASFDSTVRLWDTKSQSTRPLVVFSDAKDSVTSVAAKGHEIFTGSVDGRIRTYDLRMGMFYMDVIASPVTSVTPTIQSDSILVSSLDSKIRLIDKANGKLLQTYETPEHVNTTYRIRSTLGARDSLALSGSESGWIHAWDILTGKLKGRVRHRDNRMGKKPRNDTISAVTFNETSHEWASGGSDGTIIIWGVAK